MTTQEVAAMIASVGLPSAYDHFDAPQKPPYICFLYPNNDSFAADDRNYVQIEELSIELYADNKDFAHETAIENVLNASDLPFGKSCTWLRDEHMYMTIYTTEVIINGTWSE